MNTRITHALGAVAAAALSVAAPVGAAAVSASAAGPARPVTAYIAIWGNGRGNTVIPINTATNRAGKAIKVGSEPGNIAITPNGRTAYVASAGYPPEVVPISTATNKPGKAIKVGGGATAIAITPNGKTAYVAGNTGKVTPISTATNKPGKAIVFGKGAEAGSAYIAITPNGKTAYVAESGPYGPGNTVVPISTATNKPGKAIKVGSWPVAIAITPNGKTVYVASTGSGPTGCVRPANCAAAPAAGSGSATVTPISTATNKPGKAIKAGPIAFLTVVITPNGKTVYVASSLGVIPIRTATNKPGKTIKVAGSPGLIAITPNGKTVYVTWDRGAFRRGKVIPIGRNRAESHRNHTVTSRPAGASTSQGRRHSPLQEDRRGGHDLVRLGLPRDRHRARAPAAQARRGDLHRRLRDLLRRRRDQRQRGGSGRSGGPGRSAGPACAPCWARISASGSSRTTAPGEGVDLSPSSRVPRDHCRAQLRCRMSRMTAIQPDGRSAPGRSNGVPIHAGPPRLLPRSRAQSHGQTAD
jgi:DNA-binding beta-propeller fold protein YncE